VCFVIRFLIAKGERPAEIHKQTVAVYANVTNGQNLTKWYRELYEGRTDVHDAQRSGRPSLISDDLLQEIEGEIRTNRPVTIIELHHIIPEVSKFDDDNEVQEEVMTWFKGHVVDFCNSGIQKLVPRLNKCLNNAGDYVEK
jgi:hypothetical protein